MRLTNVFFLSFLVFSGTFHSICSSFLRNHGEHINLPKHFLIADTEDSKGIIKKIIMDKIDTGESQYEGEMEENKLANKAGEILGLISKAKNKKENPGNFIWDPKASMLKVPSDSLFFVF